MQCNPAEVGLAEQASQSLARTSRADNNTACAAVLDADGNTWLGLNPMTRMSSICAEPAAIAAAHLHGALDLVAIAAVCHTPDLDAITLISPCGACRERIWHHAPQARVLLPARPEPIAMPISDLYSHPDLFPHWTAAHPTPPDNNQPPGSHPQRASVPASAAPRRLPNSP